MTPEQQESLYRTAQRLEDQTERIERIETQVKEIHNVLIKQKGFLSGVVFLVSLLWACGVGLWQWLPRS